MRKDLIDKLEADFPDIINDKTFDLSCGDGWFDIVYNLTKLIKWYSLDVPEELRVDYHVVQIKEKFGGLRYYLNQSTLEMRGAVRLAEEFSLHI
jgi:hypothetical protein